MTLKRAWRLLSNPVYGIVVVGRRVPQILPLLKLFRLTKCPEDFDLEKIQPDPDNSSICENEIRKDYDLQIIVPVYNVEKYIEECMDSIVGQQTQWRFVVTVVNDGSPDNSRNLLRKLRGCPTWKSLTRRTVALRAPGMPH